MKESSNNGILFLEGFVVHKLEIVVIIIDKEEALEVARWLVKKKVLCENVSTQSNQKMMESSNTGSRSSSWLYSHKLVLILIVKEALQVVKWCCLFNLSAS